MEVHHTVGCLPMFCPLIHCMAAFIAKMSYAWRASRRDLRVLAGGILGFGAAEWIVLLDTFARSCFLIWCFVFVSVQDLVIQRHHQPPHWSCSGQGSLLWFSCLVGLVCFGCFLLCCFLAFPFLGPTRLWTA